MLEQNEGQKYTEKCGEDNRNVFTCSLCKFITTEQQEIKAHLETPYHKEILQFNEKNIPFGKGAAEFLHALKVNKDKKIADHKQWQQQEKEESAQKFMKDVWMGFDPRD